VRKSTRKIGFLWGGRFQLLTTPVLSSDDPVRGDLYEDLAKISSITGDFDKSMKWYQKSIEFKQHNLIISSSIQFKG